jgi:hypothetical protein
MRVALYTRVSTHDQHTLAMQMDAMREFAIRRGWIVTDALEEIGFGATDHRPKRQALLTAARRRQLDIILVWKLDRWGRSLVDVMPTLHERTALGGTALPAMRVLQRLHSRRVQQRTVHVLQGRVRVRLTPRHTTTACFSSRHAVEYNERLLGRWCCPKGWSRS